MTEKKYGGLTIASTCLGVVGWILLGTCFLLVQYLNSDPDMGKALASVFSLGLSGLLIIILLLVGFFLGLGDFLSKQGFSGFTFLALLLNGLPLLVGICGLVIAVLQDRSPY